MNVNHRRQQKGRTIIAERPGSHPVRFSRFRQSNHNYRDPSVGCEFEEMSS
jgi:hypothetical protein